MSHRGSTAGPMAKKVRNAAIAVVGGVLLIVVGLGSAGLLKAPPKPGTHLTAAVRAHGRDHRVARPATYHAVAKHKPSVHPVTKAKAAPTTTTTASPPSPTSPTSPTSTTSTTPPIATGAAALQPVPTLSGSGPCRVRGTGLYVLPDLRCTPGAVNPAVTQADIGSTICSEGWTDTVRPPESYTEPLKEHQLAVYGEMGPIWTYEEDHLVPLELGGSPTSTANLWPEPGASPNPKDAVEDAANRAVCDGSMSLAYAQHAIATNWIALGQQLGVSSSSQQGSATTATAAPTPTTAATAPAPSPAPTTGGGAFCHASAAPANDGYPGDYVVSVTSNQPDQKATASDSGDTYSEYTNGSGAASITLWHTFSGEQINITIGAASCSTPA
jgi:hypothetical protein